MHNVYIFANISGLIPAILIYSFSIRKMDNIFGKEDSGDERDSDQKDIEEQKDDKNSPEQNSSSKDNEVMEIDSMQVKVQTLSKR